MQHFKTINCLDIGTSKITILIGQFSETENKNDAKGFNVEKVISNPAANISKRIVSVNDSNGNVQEQMIYNKLNEPASKMIYEYEYYNK